MSKIETKAALLHLAVGPTNTLFNLSSPSGNQLMQRRSAFHQCSVASQHLFLAGL